MTLPAHASQVVAEGQAVCSVAQDCLKTFSARSSHVIERTSHYKSEITRIDNQVANRNTIKKSQTNAMHALCNANKVQSIYRQLAKVSKITIPAFQDLPITVPQFAQNPRHKQINEPGPSPLLLSEGLKIHKQGYRSTVTDPRQKLEQLIVLIKETQEEIQKVLADITKRMADDSVEIQDLTNLMAQLEADVVDLYPKATAAYLQLSHAITTTEARFNRLLAKMATRNSIA